MLKKSKIEKHFSALVISAVGFVVFLSTFEILLLNYLALSQKADFLSKNYNTPQKERILAMVSQPKVLSEEERMVIIQSVLGEKIRVFSKEEQMRIVVSVNRE